MFSQSILAQALTKVDQEAPDAMAAAKRARTETAPGSFKAIDVAALTVKFGEGREYGMALVDRDEAQFILTPDGPNCVLRGFDMNGEKEKRSFNSGDAVAKGNALSIYVTMDGEQAAFLERVSEKIKSEMTLKPDVQWWPLIAKNERYDNSAVSIKVALAGEESSMTALKVKQNDVMKAGKGWDFLKDQAGNRAFAFNGAEVMVVTKLRPYQKEGKAGVELVATQLAIKLQERKFFDVLPDW